MNLEPVGEPLLGLAAQFLVLVAPGPRRVGAGADREARQDRLAGLRPERAALGDLDGGRQGLRNIGEQHGHFGAGLEAVVGGELLAIGLRDQPAAGDAQQRVMGLVIVGGCKIRLVGRDQRNALGIGEIDQAGLGAALLVDAVALQFDVEPVAEQPRQPLAAGRGQRRLIGRDRQ